MAISARQTNLQIQWVYHFPGTEFYKLKNLLSVLCHFNHIPNVFLKSHWANHNVYVCELFILMSTCCMRCVNVL